jgi:hypothetical protein
MLLDGDFDKPPLAPMTGPVRTAKMPARNADTATAMRELRIFASLEELSCSSLRGRVGAEEGVSQLYARSSSLRAIHSERCVKD